MEPVEPSVAELQAALAERGRIIVELVARVEGGAPARAELRNSSRPPSTSEGYDKPKPKSRRHRGQRRTGGQPGRPGPR